MLTCHRLDARLTVAPQIQLQDLAEVARLGFRAVINNRPDGESADQPESASLEREALRLGLAYRYLPVHGDGIGAAEVAAFVGALDGLPEPVLGFCRSGTRTRRLWSLSQNPSLP